MHLSISAYLEADLGFSVAIGEGRARIVRFSLPEIELLLAHLEMIVSIHI